MQATLFTYPVQWIDRWQLANGNTVTVRPVLPQDSDLARDFVARQLTPQSRHQRFMVGINSLPAGMADYFTRIDYHDHFALIAEVFDGQGHRQIGDARFVRLAGDPAAAEFALAVADAWQGQGLGRRLLQATMSAALAHGVQCLHGDVLHDNTAMLRLARASGFVVSAHPDGAHQRRVCRTLVAASGAAAGQAPYPANDAAFAPAHGLAAPAAGCR